MHVNKFDKDSILSALFYVTDPLPLIKAIDIQLLPGKYIYI